MRTPEEIQFQIDGLRTERESLPRFSVFGDNNWEIIDIKLSMLKGRTTYGDYENDEDEIESAAYECQQWLEGESQEDLF